MKAIITGSTGMVGRAALLECLEDTRVTEVLLINRNPIPISHPKIKEVLHQDFSDFSTIADQLAGYDACYFCMGVSAGGMSEADYRRVTYDFTMALATACYQANPEMTFCYVSGDGTDSTEKGRMMWARVKGKTENDILKMGFKDAYMFRPGIIQPLKGIKSRTKLYQFFYDWFGWLLPIIKGISKHSMTTTTNIGMAMIDVHLNGNEKKHLYNKDINKIAGHH